MTNINEIKAHLSAYLERVEQGETIVICRRNHPIAELRPVRAVQRSRSIGAAGTLEVPAAFHDPLPADLVAAFSGRLPIGAAASRVADARPSYGTRAPAKKRTRS